MTYCMWKNDFTLDLFSKNYTCHINTLVKWGHLKGKYLHKEIKVGEDVFKIGTEINETIIEKLIEIAS